jgi:hypothetical protein
MDTGEQSGHQNDENTTCVDDEKVIERNNGR